MRHPPPVLRRRHVAQAGHLALGEDVPEPELDPDATVSLEFHMRCHQGLAADGPPVAEARPDRAGSDLLDKGFLVERPEQARARQIGGHHAGDIDPDIGQRADRGHGRRGRRRIRHGQGQRFDIAACDIDIEHRGGLRGAKDKKGKTNEQGRQDPSYYAPRQSLDHPPTISLGSKLNSITRHRSY